MPCTIRPTSRIAVVALTSAAALGALHPATAATAPTARPVLIAMSALGDLTPYRSIAADTLAIVDRGDLMAARTRIKDLETAWDKAEPSLKPKDKAGWTTLDKLIDAALIDLRTRRRRLRTVPRASRR